MEEFVNNFNQFRKQLYTLKDKKIGDEETIMFIIGMFEGYNLHKSI